MERTGNQIFIKPSLEEVDNTIQKMGERFGSAVSRFRERKGKADNQKKKKSHGCRKTSRAWSIPSADLELDKERSGELFSLSALLYTGQKVQVWIKYRNIWTLLSPSYASTDHLN